jgi:hypothetical protein
VISHGDKRAEFPVREYFCRTIHAVCRDDRSPEGQSFYQCHTKSFPLRRAREYSGTIHEPIRIMFEAWKGHIFGEASVINDMLYPVSILPLAQDHETSRSAVSD